MFVEVRLFFSGIHHLARVGSTFHRLFAVDQIFISLLLIDVFLKKSNGPNARALPAQQAKKTLYRPSVIQSARCLQITSPAIDLDIFKLNAIRGKRWGLLGVDYLLANQERYTCPTFLFIFSRLRCACSSVC